MSNGDATATPPGASARDEVIGTGRRAFSVGGAAAKSAAAFAYRSALPLMALYAAQADDGDNDDNPDGTPIDIGTRNRATVKAAGTKALLELVEIASQTHPFTDDATPYMASRDGQYQAPHMRHLLSLAIAAYALFQRSEHGDDNDGKGDGEQPAPVVPESQRVAYIAVAPGEYAQVTGPLSPTAIRRSAMRERAYGQPQLAMLARRDNLFGTMPETASAQAAMTAQQYGRYALSAQGMTAGHAGCGCGGSCGSSGSCGCGCSSCGGGNFVFPPAPRNEDGECGSLFTISCDTKWRIRECFKQSLCDMLRCVGDQICDDGKLATTTKPGRALTDCLEGFVCSLITCLPEAICPPPPPSTVCITQKPRDCDCNFAVGS